MSAVSDPVAAAHAVKTRAQAVSLRGRLERQLADGDGDAGTEDWYFKAEQANDHLDEHWLSSRSKPRPPAASPAPVTTRPRPPVRPVPRSSRGSSSPGRPAASSASSTRAAGALANRGARGIARRSSRFGSALLRPTSDAVSSGGEFFVKVLGWGLGLSLLYLVLNNAQQAGSSSGISRLSSGISGFVSAIVGAGADPLSPSTWKSAAPAAAAVAPAAAAAASTAVTLHVPVPIRPVVLATGARK